MPPPVRVALIGCGVIGQVHARAWSEVIRVAPEIVQIALVCDPQADRATICSEIIAAAQGWRPRVHNSTFGELPEGGIDAVDICLPVYLHHTVAAECLRDGLHVLVEKPLALTIAAARSMIDAANRAGRILALAENWRRTPAMRAAHWAIHTKGLIGKPEVFHIERSRFQAASRSAWEWRATRSLSGGGWAIDNAAHLLDMISYLLGPIASVTADVRRILDRPLNGERATLIDEREDVLLVLVQCDNGISGLITAISSLPGADRFSFAIQGRSGAIVDSAGHLFHVPDMTSYLHRRDEPTIPFTSLWAQFLEELKADEREILFPRGLLNGFAIECYDFVRAIVNDGQPEIDGQRGLNTLATSLAIYEAALARTTVAVADVVMGKAHAYQDPLDAAVGLVPPTFPAAGGRPLGRG